jgi:hypothetical protein
MNTQISSKLAALAVALVMNSLIMGAVAHLFNGQLPQQVVMSPAEPASQTSHAA